MLAVQQLFNKRVSNIVFMGMGEPLLNLPAVTRAHRCLNQVGDFFLLVLHLFMDIPPPPLPPPRDMRGSGSLGIG